LAEQRSTLADLECSYENQSFWTKLIRLKHL
jgi:hypothetical protein